MTVPMSVLPAPTARITRPTTNADVGDPGDEEGLEGGRRAASRRAVVADEQVRAPAHDLPADQREHEVVGLDDEQHRGGEERDGGGERRRSGGRRAGTRPSRPAPRARRRRRRRRRPPRARSASRCKRHLAARPTGSGPNVGTTSERPAVSANWNTDSTKASAAAATATSRRRTPRRRRSSRPASATRAPASSTSSWTTSSCVEDGHRFALVRRPARSAAAALTGRCCPWSGTGQDHGQGDADLGGGDGDDEQRQRLAGVERCAVGGDPSRDEERLAALSISSTPISTSTALRRASTP